MNISFYLAKRMTLKSSRSFSKLIVRIAIAGISLGIVVMILSIGVIRGFKSTIKNKLSGFSGDIQISMYGLDPLASNYRMLREPRLEKSLQQNPNVANYIECANKVGLLQIAERTEPVMFKGVSDLNRYPFMLESIVEGKRFTEDYNECIISRSLANRMGIKVGEKIDFFFSDQSLKIRRLKVQGIYETGIDEIDRALVIVPLQLIKRLNNWPDNQTGFYQIDLVPNANEAMVLDDLNAKLAIDQKAQSNAELYPDYYDWIGLLDVNAQVIIILMLLVAGINMVSAILIMILERSTFVGIIKAIGGTNQLLRKVFLLNVLYLITIGLIIGNALTLLLAFLQVKFQLIKLDPASYYMNVVPISLQPMDFVWINLGCIITCLFFTLLGSFLINRVSALRAIRFT